MAIIDPQELQYLTNGSEHEFLQEVEAYLREVVEEEWISGRTEDLSKYLLGLQRDAGELGLTDRTLVFKYMTACLLTDTDDPAEVAEFEELKTDLRGDEYENAHVLDVYLEYFDEEDDESGDDDEAEGSPLKLS